MILVSQGMEERTPVSEIQNAQRERTESKI